MFLLKTVTSGLFVVGQFTIPLFVAMQHLRLAILHLMVQAGNSSDMILVLNMQVMHIVCLHVIEVGDALTAIYVYTKA